MKSRVVGAAVLLVSIGGAYAQPGPEGRPPPPPMRHEVVPHRPRPEAVWVPGRWDWEHGHYVWLSGHYR